MKIKHQCKNSILHNLVFYVFCIAFVIIIGSLVSLTIQADAKSISSSNADFSISDADSQIFEQNIIDDENYWHISFTADIPAGRVESAAGTIDYTHTGLYISKENWDNYELSYSTDTTTNRGKLTATLHNSETNSTQTSSVYVVPNKGFVINAEKIAADLPGGMQSDDRQVKLFFDTGTADVSGGIIDIYNRTKVNDANVQFVSNDGRYKSESVTTGLDGSFLLEGIPTFYLPGYIVFSKLGYHNNYMMVLPDSIDNIEHRVIKDKVVTMEPYNNNNLNIIGDSFHNVFDVIIETFYGGSTPIIEHYTEKNINRHIYYDAAEFEVDNKGNIVVTFYYLVNNSQNDMEISKRITVTPNQDINNFSHWTYNGEVLQRSQTYEFSTEENNEFVAHYTPNYYWVNFSPNFSERGYIVDEYGNVVRNLYLLQNSVFIINGDNSLSIFPNLWADDGIFEGVLYHRLYAVANEGYEFSGWKLNSESVVFYTNVIANFKEKTPVPPVPPTPPDPPQPDPPQPVPPVPPQPIPPTPVPPTPIPDNPGGGIVQTGDIAGNAFAVFVMLALCGTCGFFASMKLRRKGK